MFFFAATFLSLFVCLCRAQSLPVELSDPDGLELDLLAFDVRIAAHGPLALVENHFIFRNPRDKVTEGRFKALLPHNAAISRFAMNNTGRMIEGEVVERQKARATYRDLLTRRIDPALLEQSNANEFSVRVFPLSPHVVVEFILTYSLVLPRRNGRRSLHVPFNGLTGTELSLFVFVAPQRDETVVVTEVPFGSVADAKFVDGSNDHKRLALRSEPVVDATGDLQIDFVLKQELIDAGAPLYVAQAPVASDDNGNTLFVGSVTLPRAAYSTPSNDTNNGQAEHWIVMIDTSASVANLHVLRVPMIAALLARLARAAPAGSTIAVDAFDVSVEELLPPTPVAAFDADALRSALDARLSLGLSNFESCIARAKSRVDAAASVERARVLLISDGIATGGERRDAAPLGSLLASTLAGNVPLYAVAVGDRFDRKTLNALTAGRGRLVQVPPVGRNSPQLDAVLADAVTALRKPAGDTFSLDINGVVWTYPTEFHDVAPGDELVFFVARPRTAPTFFQRPIVHRYVAALDKTREVTSSMPSPTEDIDAERVAAIELLVQREAHHAALERALDQLALAKGTERVRLSEEIVHQSERWRVLTKLTALIVLDSEWQYQQFGIDRRALTNVLVVADDGVALLSQARPTRFSVTRAPADEMNGENAAMTNNVNDGFEDGDFGEPRPIGVFGASSSLCVSWPLLLALLVLCLAQTINASYFKSSTASSVQLERLQFDVDNNPRVREYTATLASALLNNGDWSALLNLAREWVKWDAVNPEAFEALGRAAARVEPQSSLALRAFLSIAEVAPQDDIALTRSGVLCLTMGEYAHALDLFDRALQERGDNPNVYRYKAMSLWLMNEHDAAVQVLNDALANKNPNDRAAGSIGARGHRVLRDDINVIEADKLLHNGGKSSLTGVRGVISWGADAVDVDLHAYDVTSGEHCSYQQPGPLRQSRLELTSGDITDALGPESIETRLAARKIEFGVHLFAAGPFSLARGVLVVTRFDADKRIKPVIVPYVLKADAANSVLSLGEY